MVICSRHSSASRQPPTEVKADCNEAIAAKCPLLFFCLLLHLLPFEELLELTLSLFRLKASLTNGYKGTILLGHGHGRVGLQSRQEDDGRGLPGGSAVLSAMPAFCKTSWARKACSISLPVGSPVGLGSTMEPVGEVS